MKITVGRLLYKIRMRRNLQIKDVCQDICAQTTYSRYEKEECIPDMFTASQLLERMGADTSGIQYVSSIVEAEAMNLKKILDEVLIKNELLQNEELVEYFSNNYTDRTTNKQFSFLLKGKICEEKGDKGRALAYYKEGYNLTHKSQATILNALYSEQEFDLLISYMRLSGDESHWGTLYDWLINRDDYNIVKIKYIAPVTVELCKNEQDINAKNTLLDKTLTYLKTVNALNGTILLLQYKVKEAANGIKITKEELDLYLAYYAVRDMVDSTETESTEYNKGKYIRALRQELNMTQEELADGICDVTALSRYESGRMDPGQDKFSKLLKKMHRRGLNYQFSYNNSVSDLESYMKIEKCFERHKEKDAVKVFNLSELLSDAVMDDDEKYQLSERMALIEKKLSGKISEASYIEGLERLIRKTIPEYKDGNFSYHRIMNETELSILNQLGAEYNNNKQCEKRNAIYENIKSYVFKQNMSFNRSIIKAFNNYAAFIGYDGKTEEAMGLCRRSASEIFCYPTQNMLYIPVYYLGCMQYRLNRRNESIHDNIKPIRLIRLGRALNIYFEESEVALEILDNYLNYIYMSGKEE